MSGPASFERFDYLLRANKHIERKLVFDLLFRADALIGLQNHKYLGFGSMWFGDFRPAHRLLGINDLTSIERREYAERAKFNRPYACIHIVPGDCSQVLDEFDDAHWQTPQIAWFDYDGRLDESVAENLSFFIERCAPDSVVIVTVNAMRNSYRAKDGDLKKREHTAIGVLEHFLGSGTVPIRFEPEKTDAGTYKDIEQSLFPQCLSEALLTYLSHKLASSGRQTGENAVRFEALVNIGHRDGADMVTVGGVISPLQNIDRWKSAVGLFPPQNHQRVDLVPLTLKEKLLLDSCSPHLCEGFVDRARDAGLRLSAEQIEKYRQFYRHFPVFVESFL